MARYDYRCKKCGTLREVAAKIGSDEEVACDQCKEPMQRMITVPPRVIYKSSGFYVTDKG